MAAVVADGVEEIAVPIVGQTREATERNILVDQIDGELKLGDDGRNPELDSRRGRRRDQRKKDDERAEKNQREISATRGRA